MLEELSARLKRMPTLPKIGIYLLVIALIFYSVDLLIADYEPDPSIWRYSTTKSPNVESSADHGAAEGYKLCMTIANDKDFRAKIMSIPAYPKEFCGCVARRIYQMGDATVPYGTYRPVSMAVTRAAVQEGINECLR